MATEIPHEPPLDQSFRIERHGENRRRHPLSQGRGDARRTLIEQAARLVVQSLREDPPAGIVIDLSQVNYFGSVFVSFLLRCHSLAKKNGSEITCYGRRLRTGQGTFPPSRSRNPLGVLYDTPLRKPSEALSGAD